MSDDAVVTGSGEPVRSTTRVSASSSCTCGAADAEVDGLRHQIQALEQRLANQACTIGACYEAENRLTDHIASLTVRAQQLIKAWRRREEACVINRCVDDLSRLIGGHDQRSIAKADQS